MAAQKALTLVDNQTLTATGNGSAVTLPNMVKAWVVYQTVGTVTGTTPNLTVTVQHSADGTNWVTLLAMTAVTASNNVQHGFAASATDYLRPLLPYVRASYVITGTSPNFAAVTVKLLVDE